MRRYVLLAMAFLVLLPVPGWGAEYLHVISMVAPPRVMLIDGEVTGMAADLVKEGLTRAGYQFDIELVPWKRALYMIQSGTADALFYPIFTKERTEYFHYSPTPLFRIGLAALKRADSDIVIRPDFGGLDHLVLGIGLGFQYGPKGKEFMEKAHFVKIEATSSNNLGFLKLLDGRIDLLLMDSTLATHYLKQRSTLGKVDFARDEQGRIAILDYREGYLVFSRKTATAVDAANFSKALDSMIRDGTYDDIVNRYK
ncbi:transporter substrate-binding domain-containing protein [Pseudodesulfovibrio cashew]|uniref:Transporter substrate-binding domain-containing protein n=1 Tax=Pseudodesulfovibrio cashew TaxID=2678688 RepID=A0A6I6JBP4_9BACT|nr:transporter substrate-binding domain-containing protein [Pseudodesulfovibrio cashew]QGY40195.1 transporter substrate-binding domain-containing protein [Pseudodesulfovibrio cashew]